jgi:predicted enzyme related to lactoylglutathione lyase
MSLSGIQNFNIPVTDFERAVAFYGHIFDTEIQQMEFQGVNLGIFSFGDDAGKTGGALLAGDDRQPSKDGTIIYFDCGETLQPVLNRIPSAGGEIVTEKTELGPGMGFYAIFDDTEGNRLGLYSSD